MMGMITGAWVAQAVHVADQLCLADILADEGPRTARHLAARVDADADPLYRVLRALGSDAGPHRNARRNTWNRQSVEVHPMVRPS